MVDLGWPAERAKKREEGLCVSVRCPVGGMSEG